MVWYAMLGAERLCCALHGCALTSLVLDGNELGAAGGAALAALIEASASLTSLSADNNWLEVSLAQHSTAPHSTARQRTAPHGTARHRIAQHST